MLRYQELRAACTCGARGSILRHAERLPELRLLVGGVTMSV
jgi:hypothetical protein